MASGNVPMGCYDVGYGFEDKVCCYPNNQTDTSCPSFIGLDPKLLFLKIACLSGNCVQDCQDLGQLYTVGCKGNPYAPINMKNTKMYATCLAVPAIAGNAAGGVLHPDRAAMVRQFIPPNDATHENLRRVTSAVTGCLTQACLTARNNTFCYDDYCSPTRLLINSTMPNQKAINDCLTVLCQGGSKAVPFADSDIIGIGVRIPSPHWHWKWGELVSIRDIDLTAL
ncbi:hypothetical protein COL922a_008197 [Colletotrichum nupharicola]|nr:hypothetical protein COL922a_008197 [Colletotrichum nupharicola]